MTYSIDFRKKVLDVRKRNALSIEQTGRRFEVGKAMVMRWIGRLEPVKKRNTKARKIDMEALKRDVEECPDAYQYERARRFGVSRFGMFAALKRLQVSYKKNAVPSKGRS